MRRADAARRRRQHRSRTRRSPSRAAALAARTRSCSRDRRAAHDRHRRRRSSRRSHASATSRCRRRCGGSCATRPSSTSRRCSTSCRCCSSIRAHVPSAAMVRASHTLCGIHRTGGFPLVATTAKALEQALLGAAASAARRCLARAAGARARGRPASRDLVARVKARDGFRRGDDREAPRSSAELDDAAPRRTIDRRSTPIDAAESAARDDVPLVAARRRSRRRRRSTQRRRASDRARLPLGVESRRRCCDAGGRDADADAATADAVVERRAPSHCERSAARAVVDTAAADRLARAGVRRRTPPVRSRRRAGRHGRSVRRTTSCRTEPMPARAVARSLADVRDDVDDAGAADLPRGSGRALPAGGRTGARWRRTPDDRRRARSCGARCTRSRAARGWPARCASASSRT